MSETTTAARPETGAVVMAAGAGRRMGNVPKSLLQRGGEPLLLRQVRLLSEAGIDTIVVVLGHHAGRLASALEHARISTPPARGTAHLRWTVNPTPDVGTGSSLRCGLTVGGMTVSTWLVVLGDQPLLEAADVRTVLQAWASRTAGIELVLPQHVNRLGHPIAFGPAVRDAVLGAHGGQGVREWRHAHPERVLALPVPHARCTTDVDTPADIARLHEESGVKLTWPQIP